MRILVLLLLWLLRQASAKAIDAGNKYENVTQFIDYSGFEEEDLKYTLHNLTTETDYVHSTFTPPQSNRTGKILPATSTATSGQFPYFVYITATQKDGTTTVLCGGALLSDTWVVTAAQCVATAASITVVAGLIASATTTPSSTGIATIHPGYKKNYLVNDIALVRMQTPFTFGSTIYPIRIAKKDYKHELNSVTLRTMGFGPADDSTAAVADLHFVDLVQLSQSTCNQQLKEIYVSYPGNKACLSTSTSSKGFCAVDIGGPVVYTFPNDVAVTLLGINSQFQACPSAYPMSYTRIGPYIGWIKSNVKKLLT